MKTTVSLSLFAAVICVAAAGQSLLGAYYTGQYPGYPYPGVVSRYYLNGLLRSPYASSVVVPGVYPDGLVPYPTGPAAAAVAMPAAPAAAAAYALPAAPAAAAFALPAPPATAAFALPAAPAAAAVALPAAPASALAVPAAPAPTAIRYSYAIPAAMSVPKKGYSARSEGSE